jgi:serine/threonine protein kinase
MRAPQGDAADDDSEELLAPGTSVGRYLVVRRLGRGGMGEVYEAVHTSLKKRVALKILRPEVAQNKKVLARFEREGVAVARIEHPHVVDVFDVGVYQSMPFLVMEFLDGEDLGTRLKRDGALSPERTAELLLPVLAAVQCAHDEGIIHRDLKPANVFLARTRHGIEVPKVLDFGISKISDGPSVQTLTGGATLLGTPYYIPPELARGARYADARSDQYSLGVILYQCVTGKRPFAGHTLYETLHSIVQGSYEPPSLVRPDLPPAFEGLIMRCLARDPAERFPDLFAVGHALLGFATPRVRAQWEPVFEHHGAEAIEPMGPHEGDPQAPLFDAQTAPSLVRFTDEGEHDASTDITPALGQPSPPAVAPVAVTAAVAPTTPGSPAVDFPGFPAEMQSTNPGLQARPSLSSGSLEVGPTTQSISVELQQAEGHAPPRRWVLWASAALAVLSLGVSVALVQRVGRAPATARLATARPLPPSQPIPAPSQPVLAPSEVTIAPSQPIQPPSEVTIAPSQPIQPPSDVAIAPSRTERPPVLQALDARPPPATATVTTARSTTVARESSPRTPAAPAGVARARVGGAAECGSCEWGAHSAVACGPR